MHQIHVLIQWNLFNVAPTGRRGAGLLNILFIKETVYWPKIL